MRNKKGNTAIVPFCSDHLDAGVHLSRQAGWPHRQEDWQLVMDLSDGIAVIDNQEVVGTGFTTQFGPNVAALNMIIVKEGLRGQGIGHQIMHSLMQKAGNREQRLIATESGVKLYNKLGFEKAGQILQHQGTLASVSDPGVVDWCNADERDAIVELDTQANGMIRDQLIDALLVTGQIAVTRSGGRPTGFAALRRFGRGQTAGPVIASDFDQARSLLSFLFSEKAGEFMRVDCDEATGLADWLETVGLKNVGGGVKMTLNATAKAQSPGVTTFALASQALG